MRDKINQLGILLTFAILLLFGMVLVASSYPGGGIASKLGTNGLPLGACDQSTIPQSVIDDATALGKTLFGEYQEKANAFVRQTLAIYAEAKDKDFVILFNSGGWGWSPLEKTEGWGSIFTGIESELDYMGYQALLLDYNRTEESWRGRLDEATEMANYYPRKARYLASKVAFLTRHVPELKVIITGESNGTVISDRVMTLLENNPQIYSIQTGPPFWHLRATLERTLVLTSSGIAPDTFSQGNLLTIIIANLKALLGLSQTEEASGNILFHIRAPGHDYWWQQPNVYSEITNFLEQNFGNKW